MAKKSNTGGGNKSNNNNTSKGNKSGAVNIGLGKDSGSRVIKGSGSGNRPDNPKKG